MQTALLVISVSTIAGVLSYYTGKTIWYAKGYFEGWQDCKWHHNYTDTLQDAGKHWEFKQQRLN